jgi:hypothetical protein
MRRLTNFAAALAVATTGLGGVLLAQGGPPARGEQNPPPPAPVVALIGCVERIAPPATPAGSKAPAVAPAYKLIDVQPGGGSPVVSRSGTPPPTPPPAKQPPMVVDKEYLLAVHESVKLSDYQNQRVEVTGTLSAIPDAAPAQPARGEPQTPPATPKLSILKVDSIKVVSTECK